MSQPAKVKEDLFSLKAKIAEVYFSLLFLIAKRFSYHSNLA